MMVIERREFGAGGSLGEDWVIPFGNVSPHPFSKEGLKKAAGAPQFRAGAKLVIDEGKEDGQEIKISIPLADGNPKCRVYAYEVEIAGKSGVLRKAIYAAGCNLGMGHEPDGGVTTLLVGKSELPKGEGLSVSVTPLTSVGTRGMAIIVDL